MAIALARHLDERLSLDAPINIHLTGCPNSCAQHYIGDIGLLGTSVDTATGTVEGYHVYVGGGADQEQGLARELAKGLPFERVPPLIERLLRGYLDRRAAVTESFSSFARRVEIDELRTIVDEVAQ